MECEKEKLLLLPLSLWTTGSPLFLPSLFKDNRSPGDISLQSAKKIGRVMSVLDGRRDRANEGSESRGTARSHNVVVVRCVVVVV